MNNFFANASGVLTMASVVGNICLGIALIGVSGWADRNMIKIDKFTPLDAVKMTAYSPESAALCMTISKFDGQTFQSKQASPTLRASIKEFAKICDFYSSGRFESMSISIQELDLDNE